MPNTPNKNLPYPLPGDLANIPLDMEELAMAVDALPSPAAAWGTGDTKISAKTATHADPQGGTWYLADGSAVPPANTALVAMLGANFPDARGRSLVMLGTHADVNAYARNDGIALANRSPKHKSTVTDPTHGHTARGGVRGSGGQTYFDTGLDYNAFEQTVEEGSIVARATGITVGPSASSMIDTPAYQVVGNLFYHS